MNLNTQAHFMWLPTWPECNITSLFINSIHSHSASHFKAGSHQLLLSNSALWKHHIRGILWRLYSVESLWGRSSCYWQQCPSIYHCWIVFYTANLTNFILPLTSHSLIFLVIMHTVVLCIFCNEDLFVCLPSFLFFFFLL